MRFNGLPDGDAIGIIYVDGIPTDGVEITLSVPNKPDITDTSYYNEPYDMHGLYKISFYANQGDIASFQIKIGENYYTPVPSSFIVNKPPPWNYENNLYIRTVPPTGSPRSVYGYCYIDGQQLPLDNKNLILVLPEQAINAAIFPEGFFIFDFMEQDGAIGSFYITHNGKLYKAEETVTTAGGQMEYLMDIHFYTVPPCSTYNNQTDCEAAGCYWWNNACHDEDVPSCPTGVPNIMTIRGYHYIDGQLINPDALYLNFPYQTLTAVIFPDIFFHTFDCEECSNYVGTFTMLYNGEIYTAVETITTEFGEYMYLIDLHFHTIPLPELCTWVTDKGGPSTLSVTDVFEMVDSYLFSTPPTGYSFVPTLQNTFGVIDYYLGFNGDPSTGCAFFT